LPLLDRLTGSVEHGANFHLRHRQSVAGTEQVARRQCQQAEHRQTPSDVSFGSGQTFCGGGNSEGGCEQQRALPRQNSQQCRQLVDHLPCSFASSMALASSSSSSRVSSLAEMPSNAFIVCSV